MGLSDIIYRLLPVWLHECSYPEQTEHWQPEPNADVGGPLLTTVLVAIAWLTLVATAFYRLLALDSNQIASPQNSDDEPATNYVDQATSRLASRISSLRFVAGRFRGKGQPGWGNTVAKSILTLCDVQTLIGLALLVSGFLSLSHRISSYHFLLVVQTVWFAHVAQLNALSIFRFAYPTNNFVGKWGRILLGLALSALLIWAIIPTWFFNWAFIPGFKYRPQPDNLVRFGLLGGSASCPASNTVCYFEVFRSIRWHYESSRLAWKWQDTPAFGSGVAAIVLIVVNTLIRIFRVNGWLTSVVTTARRGIGKGWRGVFTDASQGDAPSQKLAAHIGLATLLTTRFHSDLLASTLSGIYWLIIPAIWGTISLNRTRSIVEVKDNNWTFGQMVSIVVVLGILLVAIGNIFTFPGIKTSSSLPTVEPAQHYTDDDETEHATPSTSRPRPYSIPSNQDAPPLLSSDYSTAPWINPAITLLLINTVFFTLLFFCVLSQWQPNVLSLVVRYLIPVLVGIPSATFVFILLGLAYEKGLSAGSTETGPYWWIMGVVWALTGGLYSVFVWRNAYGALEVVNFVIIGVGAAIGLANVLAVVAARGARRGAISL